MQLPLSSQSIACSPHSNRVLARTLSSASRRRFSERRDIDRTEWLDDCDHSVTAHRPSRVTRMRVMCTGRTTLHNHHVSDRLTGCRRGLAARNLTARGFTASPSLPAPGRMHERFVMSNDHPLADAESAERRLDAYPSWNHRAVASLIRLKLQAALKTRCSAFRFTLKTLWGGVHPAR
jgi:hypothetical protein